MDNVVVINAKRTPIGRFQGALAGVPATSLGGFAIKEVVKQTKSIGKIDEVIMGCAIQAGLGQNPARKASLNAGLPTTVGAFTVNKVCGSSLKAVALAVQAIKSGDADTVIAGGMENMSRGPYLVPRDLRFGDRQLVDSVFNDGLACPDCNLAMGTLAEKLAKKYKISRMDQDRYALNSHKKAALAWDTGRFKNEVVPLYYKGPHGKKAKLAQDEPIRRDTSLPKLNKLKPVFKKDYAGTITAGNSPGLNDGAAALILTSEKKAKRLRTKPLAVIEGYATAHIDPDWFGLAPVTAVRRLMKQTGYKIDDFDLIEENEAFAVQTLAVHKELGFDLKKVNVNGGAIALGHPIGASGARILTTLIHALHNRKKDLGLATMCLGGGGSVAMVVRRVK